jgi:hypothetical protein
MIDRLFVRQSLVPYKIKVYPFMLKRFYFKVSYKNSLAAFPNL